MSGRTMVVRRLGWGVADQAVSSIANFALGIVVARSVGAEGFGAFSLAYLTYSFVMCASRGVATDPLMVRFSGATPEAWRRATAAASGTAVVVGVLAGAVCLLAGLLHGHAVGHAFVALGLLLPVLLLQDSWRFAFFAAGRPAQALLNDLVWSLLLLTGVVFLFVSEHTNVFDYVLVFGATAGGAAAFGLLQARVWPRATAMRGWLHEHRALGGRYLVENVSIGAAGQVRFLALGGLAGLSAVGEVRAAEILMGPFMVLLMGISQVAVPEAAHVLRRAPRRLGLFCLVLGGSQAFVAAAWGLAIVVLVPDAWGVALLGELWEPADDLLPLVMAGLVVASLVVGAEAGLRALGASRRSMAAQLANAALYVVGGTLGAVVDGARGSCWGVAIALTFGAAVWWWQLRHAIDEHLATVDVAARPTDADQSDGLEEVVPW